MARELDNNGYIARLKHVLLNGLLYIGPEQQHHVTFMWIKKKTSEHVELTFFSVKILYHSETSNFK